MSTFTGWTFGRRAAALLLLALLGGCAIGPQLVRTQVTTFDTWSTLPDDRSYVFARTLEYAGSLEMQGYEDIVRDELQLKGFRQASDPAGARLSVTLRPSVTGTQVRVRDPFSDPFYRPFGWYGRGGWYGSGFYDPFWGPSSFAYDTVDIYRRRLEIDIDSKSEPGKRYYEGRVENTGDSDDLPTVMPYLIRALFADFPGNSGQTRRVDVPVVR